MSKSSIPDPALQSIMRDVQENLLEYVYTASLESAGALWEDVKIEPPASPADNAPPALRRVA